MLFLCHSLYRTSCCTLFFGTSRHVPCFNSQPVLAYHSSQEYHKNPSSLSGRKYTPFAEWKFREFNELPHLFARRLAESYSTASMYNGQFPNEKVAIVMR